MMKVQYHAHCTPRVILIWILDISGHLGPAEFNGRGKNMQKRESILQIYMMRFFLYPLCSNNHIRIFWLFICNLKMGLFSNNNNKKILFYNFAIIKSAQNCKRHSYFMCVYIYYYNVEPLIVQGKIKYIYIYII